MWVCLESWSFLTFPPLCRHPDPCLSVSLNDCSWWTSLQASGSQSVGRDLSWEHLRPSENTDVYIMVINSSTVIIVKKQQKRILRLEDTTTWGIALKDCIIRKVENHGFAQKFNFKFYFCKTHLWHSFSYPECGDLEAEMVSHEDEFPVIVCSLRHGCGRQPLAPRQNPWVTLTNFKWLYIYI